MANKSTTNDWAGLGGLIRNKADEGKLVAAEILTMNVSGTASWASNHDAGPNVHHIADGDAGNAMMSALNPSGVPSLYIIDEDFKWKLPEPGGDFGAGINAVANYINAL